MTHPILWQSRLEALETRIAPATFTWDGGADNNLWSTPENWVGDVAPVAASDTIVVFPSDVTDKVTVYDYLDGSPFGEISISGSGYTITSLDAAHDSIALHDSLKVGYVSRPGIQPSSMIGIHLDLQADATIENSAGWALQLTGTILGNGNDLTLQGYSPLEVLGEVIDVPHLTVAGFVVWKSELTFAGAVTVGMGGTLKLMGNATPNMSGPIEVGSGLSSVPDGHLWIQSPTALSGNTVSLASGSLALMGYDLTLGALNVEGFSELQIGSGHLHVNGDLLQSGFTSWTVSAQGGVSKPIQVGGDVQIEGPIELTVLASLELGTRVTIIENSGSRPVSGSFAGHPEGTVEYRNGYPIQYTYVGGDGNDVELIAGPPSVTIGKSGLSATYRDVDGDLVTVKTNKGKFTQENFELAWGTDLKDGVQLRALKLGEEFLNANVTFTAVPSAQGGNGRVNIGAISSLPALGSVTIPGDLGQIDISGTVHTTKTGLRILDVGSVGAMGLATQSPQAASLDSSIAGNVPKIRIRGGVEDAHLRVDGTVSSLTVAGDATDAWFSASRFGKLSFGGDLQSTSEGHGTAIIANQIGAITVGGGIIGAAELPVTIQAIDDVSLRVGPDVIIGRIVVGGSVTRAVITAGVGGPSESSNPHASIGSVQVTGNWIASSISAGVKPGTDGFYGTGDDIRALVPTNERGANQIQNLVIRGEVMGTADDPSDAFGIVAETIKSARIKSKPLVLRPGAISAPDMIPLANTGLGPSNAPSDVFLREYRS